MGMTQIKCKCPGELCCPCNGPCTLVLTQPLLCCECPVPVVDREPSMLDANCVDLQ